MPLTGIITAAGEKTQTTPKVMASWVNIPIVMGPGELSLDGHSKALVL